MSHHAPFPALRADLATVDEREDGHLVIRDVVTGDLHTFSPIARLIATHLDGQRDAEALLALVRDAGHDDVQEDDIFEFVADLGDRLLLDLPEIAAQLHEIRSARMAEKRAQFGQFEVYRGPVELAAEEIEVLDDLRYACQSCGICCGGRFRVQLTPHDLSVLEALDLSQIGLDVSTLVEAKVLAGSLDESEQVPFLRQREGRCVALDDTGLCSIHRAFGYDRKPVGCRIFPFYPMISPTGGVIQFRPECSTQHRSRRTGPPIATRRAELWGEITEGLEVFPALPRVVTLTRGRRVGYGEVVALEGGWLDATRREGWRGGLCRMASDLEVPELRRGRPMQNVLGAILHYAQEDRHLLGRARQDHTFQHVFGRKAGSLHLFEVLLGTTGVFRPGADVAQLAKECERVTTTLSIVDRPDFDAIIADYLTVFVSSKYAYHGFSIAAGLGLCALVVFGARRTVAYTSAVLRRPLTPDLMNEALVAWHLLVFNHDTLRGRLVAYEEEALEALLGLPGHLL